jgi:pilus assembly protein Flp/PilA
MQRFIEFVRTEDAATAVEYAVMLSLIIGVCVGAVMSLGLATGASFGTSRDAILSAVNP